MKIIIFGASGSGTTTLGRSLGRSLGWPHLDVDDYYWEPTDPPFEHKIPLEIRNSQLKTAVASHKNVIVSGSLISWGVHWSSAFNLGVFLHVPPAIRMKRLEKREKDRYGTALYKDASIQKKSAAFLDWARQYDDPTFEGRSITAQQNWIKTLSFEVLTLYGEHTNTYRVEHVIKKITS